MTIGARSRRLEDPPLLRGDGRYADDLIPADACHVAFLRSPHAHALMPRVDVSAVLAEPEVVAAVTAADFADDACIALKFPLPNPEAAACRQPVLARERVRYVGEPIAVIAASSRYLAEDVLHLVDVEYEPLPPIVDAEAGAHGDSPLLFPDMETNVVAEVGSDRALDSAAFDRAPVLIDADFEVGRHFAVPIETRGLVADFDPRRGLTVWGPTKSPHFTRDVVAEFVGLPEHRVHVIEPDVGGGFGGRGEVYAEDLVIPWLAMRLRRPVAWIEDRHEHLVSSNHSREQRHSVRLAVDDEGQISALRDRIVNDQGAYLRNNTVAVAELTCGLLPGPYRIEAFEARAVCVMTNKTPHDVYRAPGRYEGTFVRERLVDMAAHRLGLDPVELRMRNFVQPEQMPYSTGASALGSPTVYDSGNYPSLLEQAVKAIGYHDLRAKQQAERDSNAQGHAHRYLGIGVSSFVEKSGYGPWEFARVEVSTSGEAVLFTGISSVGQGMSTALAQIVAEELTIEHTAVDVIYGDTDRVPFGVGAYASRGTVVGGSAALGAVRKVKDMVFALASEHLEASRDDLELAGGVVSVKGAPDRRVSLGDLAAAALPGRELPAEMEPGLAASNVWNTDHMTYPGGACACTVVVDVESGAVDVLDFVVAYDIGRAINPLIVEGQVHGGVVQGIGGALLEEMRYNEDGQPLCTSFMDYLLPTSMEAPRSIHTILDESTPSPLNPLGAKGAGEAGITGVGACIANAVSDALQPFGVEITKLPITHGDLRRLISEAQGHRAA